MVLAGFLAVDVGEIESGGASASGPKVVMIIEYHQHGLVVAIRILINGISSKVRILIVLK